MGSFNGGPNGYQAMLHADECSCAEYIADARELAACGSAIKMAKKKNMGLHQVVRLRQMLLQWRRRAASNMDRSLMQVMSPRARKLLRGSSSCGRSSTSSSSAGEGNSAGRCSGSEGLQQELPRVGHLAIYVGQERRRFEIRAEHINHPLLRGLLERTEEEFGLNRQGGLAIPACEIVLFEHLLWMVENEHGMQHLLEDPAELRELLDFYMQRAGIDADASSSALSSSLADTSASVSAC